MICYFCSVQPIQNWNYRAIRWHRNTLSKLVIFHWEQSNLLSGTVFDLLTMNHIFHSECQLICCWNRWLLESDIHHFSQSKFLDSSIRSLEITSHFTITLRPNYQYLIGTQRVVGWLEFWNAFLFKEAPPLLYQIPLNSLLNITTDRPSCWVP